LTKKTQKGIDGEDWWYSGDMERIYADGGGRNSVQGVKPA
jgi:hypothetical protein